MISQWLHASLISSARARQQSHAALVFDGRLCVLGGAYAKPKELDSVESFVLKTEYPFIHAIYLVTH
jgi:hypothetical protein